MAGRVLLAFAALLSGCGGDPPAWPPIGEAPANDPPAARCMEVAAFRVCWPGVGARGETILVPRPVPAWPVPEAGWRCFGSGAERVCEDRARGAGAWVCSPSGSCVQAHPRLPDDGEWECVDLDGAAICRRGERPAGVIAGPPDPGFTCAPRRGHPGERLCLDLSPDMPEGDTAGWRCRYTHDGGETRHCERRPDAPPLGRPCHVEHDCIRASRGGLACVAQACVPMRAPVPNCWLDGDCGPGGACRLGSCR